MKEKWLLPFRNVNEKEDDDDEDDMVGTGVQKKNFQVKKYEIVKWWGVTVRINNSDMIVVAEMTEKEWGWRKHGV